MNKIFITSLSLCFTVTSIAYAQPLNLQNEDNYPFESAQQSLEEIKEQEEPSKAQFENQQRKIIAQEKTVVEQVNKTDTIIKQQEGEIMSPTQTMDYEYTDVKL